MFPSIESVGRRFAFLHRVLRGEFPCFHGTIKALRLPAAHPAALRCLRLAVPRWHSREFAPRRPSAPSRPGVGHPVSPSGNLRGDKAGSPKFLGNLNCPSARVLTDAGRTARTRPVRCSSVAPGPPGAKAPTKGLSTPNSMAFGLAVYASQGRLLRPHARLASGCWSGSTGRAFHPQDSAERFQDRILTSLSSSPKLCLAQWGRPLQVGRLRMHTQDDATSAPSGGGGAYKLGRRSRVGSGRSGPSSVRCIEQRPCQLVGKRAVRP
jgi:hypothetical protein